MKSKLYEKSLGTFNIETSKVLVTDPCYKKDEWCNHTVKNVKTGKWRAKIYGRDCGSWGHRVAFLVAGVKDEVLPPLESYKWHLVSKNIGVDSGQIGFYDKNHYKDDNVVKNLKRKHNEIICENEPWYSFNCDRTLSKDRAGIIPFGCVSSSGYGDGVYSCWTLEKNDKVIGIAVNFQITGDK